MKIRPNDPLCIHVQKFRFPVLTFSCALNFHTPEFDVIVSALVTEEMGDATTPPWTSAVESSSVLKWETWSRPNCFEDHSAIAPMFGPVAPTVRRALIACVVVPLEKKPHAANRHGQCHVRTRRAPICVVAPPRTTLSTRVGRTSWYHSTLLRKTL